MSLDVEIDRNLYIALGYIVQALAAWEEADFEERIGSKYSNYMMTHVVEAAEQSILDALIEE